MEKLKGLNEHKAFGVDKVSPYVLKKSAEAFSVPLTLIFQKSLDTGEVPNEWREANVSPIFKKGSKLEPANYRPVSLTSIVCKTIESIIKDRIMIYLVENDLIAPEQHEFVPKKACNTNLLETMDLITEAINLGFIVDLILLDFAKAFDKVSHAKLIHKLTACGVNQILVRWIKAFLTNRRQRVVIGDNYSCWEEVLSGVPQGSVLGPLLFIIFINDLPKLLNHLSKLFADDCKIIGILREPNDSVVLQNDINKLQEWAKVSQMSFNYSKCKSMHFGRNNPGNVYTMKLEGDEIHQIEKTELERDLGILISNNLKWENQVNKAAKTANSVIAQIKNSFTYFDSSLVKLLYVSLVRPHLEYAVSVWNPYMKKDIDKLESVQHRATRLVPCLRKKPYELRLKKLQLTNLEIRRQRGDLIQYYKVINGLDKIRWSKEQRKLTQDNELYPASNLRRTGLTVYRESVSKLRAREEFFLNRVAPIWNKLPVFVKEARSLNCFKAELDKLESFSV